MNNYFNAFIDSLSHSFPLLPSHRVNQLIFVLASRTLAVPHLIDGTAVLRVPPRVTLLATTIPRDAGTPPPDAAGARGDIITREGQGAALTNVQGII